MSSTEKIFCIYCKREIISHSDIIRQAHKECQFEFLVQKYTNITSLVIYSENTYNKNFEESDNNLYVIDKSIDIDTLSLLINLQDY